MEKNSKVDVSIQLKANKGEPSHAWARLWHRLLSNRKANPPANRENASDGDMSNGNDANLSHE